VSNDISAAEPLALLRRCRALEARAAHLEKKNSHLSKQVCELAGAVETLARLADLDVEFLLAQVNVCGKRNTETGNRCSLPAKHKATVHSSGRLPRQGS
jgi:hypothetical protein